MPSSQVPALPGRVSVEQLQLRAFPCGVDGCACRELAMCAASVHSPKLGSVALGFPALTLAEQQPGSRDGCCAEEALPPSLCLLPSSAACPGPRHGGEAPGAVGAGLGQETHSETREIS